MSKETIYMLMYLGSMFILTAISISIGQLAFDNKILNYVVIPGICILISNVFLIDYFLVKYIKEIK